MINKTLLELNIRNALGSSVLLREGIEIRRINGMLPMEALDAEVEWHKQFKSLLDTLIELVGKLEVSGNQ